MDGIVSDAQIASILTALRIKGETVEEISGAAQAMRSKAELFKVNADDAVDNCGTGGDSLNTFNISTTASIVAAGAGVKIAKHGNRSVSSKCGSADILKYLGVNIDISINKVEEVFQKAGFAFLFAPLYHKAMRFAIGPRKEMAIRTIFNVLGPLTNPAGVKRQVLGVYKKSLCGTISKVLKRLGSEHVLVVHGENGMDEFSICGATYICELKNNAIKKYEITPEQAGLKSYKLDEIQSPDCSGNLNIIRKVLSGEKGAARDAVVFNAGACIYVSGKADSILQGVKMAQESIESKNALLKLDQLILATNE